MCAIKGLVGFSSWVEQDQWYSREQLWNSLILFNHKTLGIQTRVCVCLISTVNLQCFQQPLLFDSVPNVTVNIKCFQDAGNHCILYIWRRSKHQLLFPISTAITQHLWGKCFVDTESLCIREKLLNYWTELSDPSLTSVGKVSAMSKCGLNAPQTVDMNDTLMSTSKHYLHLSTLHNNRQQVYGPERLWY